MWVEAYRRWPRLIARGRLLGRCRIGVFDSIWTRIGKRVVIAEWMIGISVLLTCAVVVASHFPRNRGRNIVIATIDVAASKGVWSEGLSMRALATKT